MQLVVGIDARAASEVTAGRGRVVRELLRALGQRDDPHRYRCYARTRWEGPLDGRFEWVDISARDPLWHARTAADANRECDVFLSSNSYLTVLLLRIPAVGVIYDLLALDPATSPNRRSAIVERLTLRSTVRRARALWCISQATADELVARHPEARAKVEVVPLGVSPELAQDGAGDGLPGPGFVLAVGTLEPRKNLPRLVSAYSSLAVELQTEHPLVVVGAHGWRTGETLSALESLGSRGVLLGEVSDGELAELYRRCAVFCYPSLGEGFGLPVLEAMAAGAAVLTSEDSSLPEVGGDAVEYADPRSVASITDGLDRLLRAPERRAELGERARVRAGCFSWEETAARVLELLEQTALTERSSPPSRTRTRTS